MKKKILATSILTAFCVILFGQSVKAETEIKTTIQIKYGATQWTNISVSDAYDKCQELNNDNSALGTTGDNVMAHLSTNADWFAVSLLTMSGYGSKTNNNTTGNSSGVMNLGHTRTYTAGISEEYDGITNITYLQSLVNAKNNGSKFVETIKKVREENKPGLGVLASEDIINQGYRYYGGVNYAGKYPITTRLSLFNISVGNNSWGCGGYPEGSTTFRPVIWVK